MVTQRSDTVPTPTSTHYYLAEVCMPIQGGHDLSWIAHGLHAACRRLRRTKPDLRIVGVVYSPADKRLAAIVEAASSSDVSDLFAIALLPSARVLEVWQVEENGPQFRAG